MVTKEQIDAARQADLYGFLLARHGEKFKKEGTTHLKAKDFESLSIKAGFPGYYRFSTGEHGNNVDLLIKYLNYSFTGAVQALLDYSNLPVTEAGAIHEVIPKTRMDLADFPQTAQGQYKRVFAYLTKTRGLLPATVNALIKAKLLYQDERGNAVFINRDKTFVEIRGTLSEKPYHQSLHKAVYTPFWSVTVGTVPEGEKPKVFICESCIDAVSLYELKRIHVDLKPGSVFCSIGGVGKQQAIDYIVRAFPGCVTLAVDNDDAGGECRKRNHALPYILPVGKDWNEDLLEKRKRK